MHSILKKLIFLWILFFTSFLFADEGVKIHISNATANEDDSTMTFTISLSQAPLLSVTIDYKTIEGSAKAGSDFIAKNDHLVFEPGTSSKTFTIQIVDDNKHESTEYFYIQASSTTKGYSSDNNGRGTIYDNDVDNSLKIGANCDDVKEGDSSQSNNMECTIYLNRALLSTESDVTIHYNSADGDENPSAKANEDYKPVSGNVTFHHGETQKTIYIPTIGDNDIEYDENVKLKISGSSYITDSTGSGWIINDDGSYPAISFEKNAISIVEGNSGQTFLEANITFDKPALAGSSFTYGTWDDTAEDEDGDNDYINTQKSVKLDGGERYITIRVPINGDTKIEDDELFHIGFWDIHKLDWGGRYDQLDVTILNDDGSFPTMSVDKNKFSIIEGNTNKKQLNFTFKLNKPAFANSSFKYFTRHIDTNKDDYIEIPSTTYIFKGGERQVTIPVTINGDTKVEDNETFNLYIKDEHNLNISGTHHPIGIIINDDIKKKPYPDDEPLVCDESMYLSSSIKRGTGERGKMWLHKIDTQKNPFEFDVVDDDGDTKLYNALAYSDSGDKNTTNFIFGLYHDELLRIGRNGTPISLGKIPALSALLSNRQFYAGAIYDGYYYISGPGVEYDKIFKIKLSDKTVTEIKLNKAISLLDFSFTPDGKYLHGIIDGGELVKINIATGVVTPIGSAHTGYQFDSTFSDKNGRFFANDSKGNGFFEFNLKTGEKRFLSASQKADFNDGANCLKAELLFTDYGDAPISYGPAWHNIANGIYLGDKVDHDIDSYDTVNADGDDLNGVDDDDGVTLVDGTDINGSYFKPNKTHQLKVKLSKEAYLKIWIDKGIDGHFDNSTDLIYSSGTKLSAGEHTITFTLPNGLVTNKTTYLRARVSSSSNINPTGFLSDGEVEDYAIKFGSKTEGVFGTFNVERVGSNNLPINSDERNAWYTQIVGKDFDYHVVFYNKDMTKELNLTNVPIKVELIDQDKNISIATPHYDYFSASSLYKSRVLVTKPIYDTDLKDTFASRNARFRVEYPAFSDGSIKPFVCSKNLSPKECFDQALSSNATYPKSSYARDNFAIRPDMIYVNISDHNQSRLNSKKDSSVSLASGYKYNLTVTATQYLGENPAKGYTKEANSSMELNSTGLTCNDTSPISENIDFTDGIFYDSTFTHNNVGKYLLKIEDDKSWTKVDQNSSIKGCIEGSGKRIANAEGKVGCDIVMSINNPVELNFQPDHFAVNLNMLNLPQNAGHDDFIYMMNLNANNNNVAIAFNGNIIAQNADNNATSNFTAGCVATNILLNLNTTTVSDGGINNNIHAIDNITPVNFSRVIRFNGENNPANYDVNNTLRKINTVLPISSDKFLNDRNGSMTLDMRYNLNKTLKQPINPVEIRFHNIDVNATDANSSSHQVDNHVPSGTKAFPNNIREFYFARVVSDLNNYPRVNMHISPLVRTPLNVDIYCGTTIANYCRDRHVLNHTSLSGTVREQNGWYLSTDHNGATDGNITALTPDFNTITIAPNPTPLKTDNDDITLNHGHNGTINGTFNNCTHPTITVAITTDPALAFTPSQYTLKCTNTDPSQWTGVGKTGNVLEVKPKVDRSGKMDW